MTVSAWMLVGFATWTVLLLLATVGVHYGSRILTRRAPIRSFRADQIEGADWHMRAMRAHAKLRRKPSVRRLRVLFCAERQLSVVDWTPGDQAEWKRITIGPEERDG